MDTKDQILAAASELYLDGGMKALSMRKVAEIVDISATAIYRHFDSKEALLTAVCAEGYRLFAQSLWRGLEGNEPLERLRLTGLGYLDFALEHPAFYRVMFMSTAVDEGMQEWFADHREQIGPTFLFLVDRIRECVDAGEITSGADVRVLAAEVWSHSHGMVSLWLIGEFGTDLETADDFRSFYSGSMDRHFRGLAP